MFTKLLLQIPRDSEVTYCFKPCILDPDDGSLGPKHLTFIDNIRIFYL